MDAPNWSKDQLLQYRVLHLKAYLSSNEKADGPMMIVPVSQESAMIEAHSGRTLQVGECRSRDRTAHPIFTGQGKVMAAFRRVLVCELPAPCEQRVNETKHIRMCRSKAKFGMTAYLVTSAML